MYTVKVYSSDEGSFIFEKASITSLADAKRFAHDTGKQYAKVRNASLMGVMGKRFPSEVVVIQDGMRVWVGYGLDEWLSKMPWEQSSDMNGVSYEITVEAS